MVSAPQTDWLAHFSQTTCTTILFGIEELFTTPVIPIRLELLELPWNKSNPLLRLTTADGAFGLSQGNSRHCNLLGILEHLVAPSFIGKDLRRIEHLVDEIYCTPGTYKYAGMPLFNCIGLVEMAALDLLARIKGIPVYALLGRSIRTEVPVYLSRLTRDTTPEQEVEIVQRDLRASGAKAVKIKIGGRMLNNRDAFPQRTENLVPLLRKSVGSEITLYADANGSYDVATAVRVGRLLEENSFAFFEEPCPWQEFEGTKSVADALDVPIAGGEQDSSLPQFAWMIRHRGVDLVQPDFQYVGGFIRASRVAKMADQAKMMIVPHSPGAGFRNAPLLHFAAITPNLGVHVEMSFSPEIKNGVVSIPQSPGWGTAPEAAELERAKTLLCLDSDCAFRMTK